MRNRLVKKIGLVCAFLAVAGIMFCAFGRALVLASLTIHAPQHLRSLSFDGKPTPVSGTTIRISPLIYGLHDLRLEMLDGKVVYASFFHSDTGVDRQVNIYVAYRPHSNTAAFRQTITRYETFPGVTRTVFTGTTKPEHTSKTNPFQLDWI